MAQCKRNVSDLPYAASPLSCVAFFVKEQKGRIAIGSGNYAIVSITAFVLFGVTIMCSHRRVPPDSVLTVQKSLSADTVLCFSEHHGALQFPHRSFQKSSTAIRLLVYRPASCAGLRQAALPLFLCLPHKRIFQLHHVQSKCRRCKADFPLAELGQKTKLLVAAVF